MKYHYTNRIGWDGIRAAQQIAPSTINIEKGELAVVWFTSNPTWDYSARANIRLGLEINGRRFDYKLSFPELRNGLSVPKHHINIPPTALFRISISDDIAPMTWAQYRNVCNVPVVILNMMEQEQGVHPNEWFASTTAVSHQHCQSVHQWNRQTDAWEEVADPW